MAFWLLQVTLKVHGLWKFEIKVQIGIVCWVLVLQVIHLSRVKLANAFHSPSTWWSQ